jgi:hypothetical protein
MGRVANRDEQALREQADGCLAPGRRGERVAFAADHYRRLRDERQLGLDPVRERVAGGRECAAGTGARVVERDVEE